MKIQITDFNNADNIISEDSNHEWQEIEDILLEMPLHLKASDQAGLQGNPIFDPVGTNSYIKEKLVSQGWDANIPIPEKYSFMGTDVDFGKNKIIVEVQFSNYPFLLNNTLRSELFFQGHIQLTGDNIETVIIITKDHMFPASNSTLYYEQGKNQLTALAKHNVFDVPIRLVGIFEEYKGNVDAIWTTYDNPRYSRTVVKKQERKCNIQPGRSPRSRATITF